MGRAGVVVLSVRLARLCDITQARLHIVCAVVRLIETPLLLLLPALHVLALDKLMRGSW